MTYASQQDMIDRFGEKDLIELTDRLNTGAIDTVVLGQALADADEEINTYISTIYNIPLSSIPSRLIKMAADIARYDLYGGKCPDQVRQRYLDAVSFLNKVVSGTVSLGLDQLNQTVPDTGMVGMNPKKSVFNSTQLSDYNKPPYIF